MSNRKSETENTQHQTSSSVAESATNSKATPGPWKSGGGTIYAPWPEREGDRIIADLLTHHGDNGLTNDEVTANAQLMAASPEMLEALEGLVTAYLADAGEDLDLLCVSCGHTSSSHTEDYCSCGECVEYISPTLALEAARAAIEQARSN